MNIREQQRAAAEFAKFWEGKGDEKGQSQTFWLMLLQQVYGVERPDKFISFENRVPLANTSFIDGYIDETHTMIEQKSIAKDLRKPIKQSDGSTLTPFQQAQRYAAALPRSLHPRWIVTCNFREFLIYDMEAPNSEPESVLLKNLEKEYWRLQFLVDTGNEDIKQEMEVSIQAGRLVGEIYDALLNQYDEADRDNPQVLRSLNVLSVRLVFCMYAEDAGIFKKHNQFSNYLAQFKDNPSQFRSNLIELFKILNQDIDERDKYLDDDLNAFPYVNGGLFADENVEIPRFSPELINLILNNAGEEFDWAKISPTIFGAVFESTLNPETRRSGGMHYTSIENIHKVIDPLFLNDLKAELEEIKKLSRQSTINDRVDKYCEKLASLKFLDKSTIGLIQKHDNKSAVKPPFLGGFFIFRASAVR